MMSSKLHDVLDLPSAESLANCSVSGLAKLCNVSTRTVERRIRMIYGKTPKAWLVEQRSKKALEFLCKGASVKETALSLGYPRVSTFTRHFKKTFGQCPSSISFSHKLFEPFSK